MPTAKSILKLTGESLWLSLGQVAAMAASLVSVRMLTDRMTEESYGTLSLALTLVTLINQVVHGPLQNGAMRLFSSSVEQEQVGAFWVALRFLAALSSLLILLLALAVGYAISLPSAPSSILLLASAYAVLAGGAAVLSGLQSAARQRRVVALHQGAGAWVRLVLAVASLWLVGATADAALLGFCVGAALVLTSQVRQLVRCYSSLALPADRAVVRLWCRKVVKFSLPFVVWSAFLWGQQSSDRWALELFRSTSEVGRYAVISQLGYYPFSIFAGMLFQLVAPILFQRAADAASSERVHSSIRLNSFIVGGVLMLTILAYFVFAFFHEEILILFAGERFRDYSYLLPWQVVAGGLFAAGQTLAINQMTLLESSRLLYPRIVTSSLGIALNFYLGWSLGVDGVVIANLIYSCLFLGWMFFLPVEAKSHRSSIVSSRR